MTETLRVKVVTPSGSLIDEDAVSFTSVSSMGQFCILPDHRPIMAALVTGGMVTALPDGTKAIYALDRGFLEAGGDHVNVITEQCVPAEKLEAATLEAEIKDLENQLKELDLATDEAMELTAARDWAQVRLDAVKS